MQESTKMTASCTQLSGVRFIMKLPWKPFSHPGMRLMIVDCLFLRRAGETKHTSYPPGSI